MSTWLVRAATVLSASIVVTASTGAIQNGIGAAAGLPSPARLGTAQGDAATGRVAAVPGTEVVTVTIPDVVLPARLQVSHSRLRVPVVLAASGLTAVARVAGAPGCTTPLVPSYVTWIDCAVPRGRVVLEIRTSDGRTVVRSSVDRSAGGTEGR